MKRSAWLTAGAVACAALGSFARSAEAQPSTRAVAAEKLFDAGRDLLLQHKYKEACEKLDASQKLDPAVGTLFSLGECYAGEGRIASAWFAYRAASSLATQRGDLRRGAAEQRANALEPKLATIVVHVSEEAAQVSPQISIDGEPFAPDALRGPIAVDPGAHTIAARAPGRKTWSTRLDVRGESETMTADVPVLELLPPPDLMERERAARMVRRNVGLGFAGAGVVALGVGAVFGLQAIVKGRDANQACPGGGACANAAAVHENDVAKTYADVSTVTLPIGVALVGVGTYFLWTARSPRTPEISAQVSQSGARVGLGWSW